jgi:hypothetical protein
VPNRRWEYCLDPAPCCSDKRGYAPYFNHTFTYEIYYNEIYYNEIYFYEIYFYGSILLQTVYTSP